MTTTNAELRALAEKATPGEWHVDQNYDVLDEDSMLVATPTHSTYSAYIVAAHPARIIELLSQLDSRDEQIADQIDHIGKWESRAHRAEDETKALHTKLDLAIRALVHAKELLELANCRGTYGYEQICATLTQLKEQP